MIDPITRQQFAARRVFGAGSIATTLRNLRSFVTQVIHQRAHGSGIDAKVFGARIDVGLNYGHITQSR